MDLKNEHTMYEKPATWRKIHLFLNYKPIMYQRYILYIGNKYIIIQEKSFITSSDNMHKASSSSFDFLFLYIVVYNSTSYFF